jgi:hypothetical protein
MSWELVYLLVIEDFLIQKRRGYIIRFLVVGILIREEILRERREKRERREGCKQQRGG